MERAIDCQDRLFRKATLQSPFPVLVHASDGDMLLVSDAWKELTGYSHEEISTVADWMRKAFGENPRLSKVMGDRLDSINMKQEWGEYVITTSRGEKKTCCFSTAPLGTLPDGQRLFISTVVDVTDRKRVEEALQMEQRLLRHALEMHERDRRLTAYEIHDGFVQQSTGALLHLQGFRERQAREPEEAWKDFDEGLQSLRRSIDEARRLIGGLRPQALDNSGVVAAIKHLADESHEGGGAKITFQHHVDFDRLPSPLENAVFWIVQEALRNARRHSGSEAVYVELTQQDCRLHIEVRDWGSGFDPAKVGHDRFGLEGVQGRARLLGGRAVIDSAPGKGTHITVNFPLTEDESDCQEACPNSMLRDGKRVTGSEALGESVG